MRLHYCPECSPLWKAATYTIVAAFLIVLFAVSYP